MNKLIKQYSNLSDADLKELIRLRLANERAEITITEVEIDDKSEYPDEFTVSFIIKTKEWADYRVNIIFTRFYPDEFLFLQKCGIDFT